MRLPGGMWEPDNPRENMEPTDMNPEDARIFLMDLYNHMNRKLNRMDEDEFITTADMYSPPVSERGKQYYGSKQYQLLSGIVAALNQWDEYADDVQELKEEYGGKFVEGVEIGERLAVYEGRDFTFTEEEGSESDDSDGKFTFTE